MAEEAHHRSLVQSLLAWFRRATTPSAALLGQQPSLRDGVQRSAEDPDARHRQQEARAQAMERAARQARGMAPRQRGRGGMEY